MKCHGRGGGGQKLSNLRYVINEQPQSIETMNRSYFSIDKVLDKKPLVSLFVRSIPTC